MKSKVRAEKHPEHSAHSNGAIEGGEKWSVESIGLKIRWQDGPLGRGANRKEPNGAFVETLIRESKQRLEFYEQTQDGKFSCFENQQAILALDKALAYLNNRTKSREVRGVEGTDEA